MGYTSKDIAVIAEPKQITLSASPNFVQFESKPGTKTYLELNIEVKVTSNLTNISTLTQIVIKAPDGTIHTFQGTTDPSEVSGNIFFVSSDISDTAENIKQVFLADKWINANFEVVIPFVWVGGIVTNGNVINLKSKGAGDEYELTLTAPGNTGNTAYVITWVNNGSTNNDSISGEASTAEIDLDVYIDPDIFLGQDDRPIDAAKIGKYLITLSKTYAGTPVWFELNALFNQYPGYTLPSGSFGWFDTGTINIYRFVAKVKAYNSFAFYQSNALYVINGYGRVSDTIDLEEYVYEADSVKLLTNKPKTPYVRGQREYLNFILKDTQRGISNPLDFSLGIAYQAYSTAGDYLGTIYNNQQMRASFSIVNTCSLNIDTILGVYPTTGIIKVALARDTAIVSNDLEYEIRPDCLHSLKAFTFLNRLGGWDTFNFDAETQDEIKPKNETYNKTLTPSHKKGNSLETVYNTSLSNILTVEGSPVSNEVAEWLKELAAARTILDNEGNYIIIEDFILKQTSATSNQHIPTIKYRLSENYTNG